MSEDAVRRTDAVAGLGRFLGRQPEQQPGNRSRHDGELEAAAGEARSGHDEVCVRWGTVPALRLLRERVLATTRRQLAVGTIAVPVFAEVVECEAIESFVSRLLSDQNQLAARTSPVGSRAVRRVLNAAFEAGHAETAELLADAPGDGGAAIAAVAVEFRRRVAELDS